MHRLLFIIFSVFFFAFTSCAPNSPATRVYVPPAPQVQKNVKPIIVEIQTNNSALKDTVAIQKKTIDAQKTEIDQAISNAKALRDPVGTNWKIADDLILQLNSVKMRNLFLETTTGELMTRLNNQIILTEEAIGRASLKDAESIRWQEVNVTKDTIIRDLESERNAAMITRDKNALEAANAKVYKRWILWCVFGFVAWIIVKNVLMIYFPLARFRI